MMKLKYAGGEVFISDAASEVLLRYAERLAARGTSDTVTIPALTVEGQIGDVRILVGPASELLALPTTQPDQYIDDVDVIRALQGKTAALQRPHPLAMTAAEADPFFDDPDLG